MGWSIGQVQQLARIAVCVPTGILSWGCSIYTEDLLTPRTDVSGNGAGAGDTTNVGGGDAACAAATDCPGEDTDCETRTCDAGACGWSVVSNGTPVAQQAEGDCQTAICEDGTVVFVADESDTPVVSGRCERGVCDSSGPKVESLSSGTACEGGYCDPTGECVECTKAAHCPGGTCVGGACVAASCDDTFKTGNETDIDCGGDCTACALGKDCNDGSDCTTGVCKNGMCQASCADGSLNQDETDIDCGGSCGPCTYGDVCQKNSDCTSGSCSGVCDCAGPTVLISEIRTRGEDGGLDEFVELFNPTPYPVVIDETWTISGRSHSGTSAMTKWSGLGDSIPAFGYYLVAGAAYAQDPEPDSWLDYGVTDAGAVYLMQGDTLLDTVCFHYSTDTRNALTVDYECEGDSMTNAPHKDASSGTGNADVSFARYPGSGLGACADTDNNSLDFFTQTPSQPSNSLGD